MNDIQKMFQTIINGQSAFKQEVMSRIDRLDEKFDRKIDNLEENLTSRIDKLGRQLAYLKAESFSGIISCA